MQGIYFLVLHLKEENRMQVGALGSSTFEPGIYVYVGSAQKGVETRVARHLDDDKNIHWHIDYLSKEAEIRDAIAVKGDREEECRAASYMASEMDGISDFGSSDCDCDSHLFYWGNDEKAIDSIVKYLEEYPSSRHLKFDDLRE